MIRMLSAYTTEIDEINDAYDEIIKQIDLNNLDTHSVGILYCHPEFAESGVATAICDRLPFDVIGMTVAAVAGNGSLGTYGLSLCVLTGNDISFKSIYTDPFTAEDFEAKIDTAYQQARASMAQDPAFIISCFPMMNELMGYRMLDAMDKSCAGLPIYGGVCYGINFGNEKSCTLFNNQSSPNAIGMILVNGNVQPEFKAMALPDRYTRHDRAVITESEGPILRKVNDMPMLDYLSSVGYTVQTGAPIMVYYEGNDKPIALSIYMTFEDGSILCGGECPVGAAIALGDISREVVLETSNESIKYITEAQGKNAAIIVPCSVRYFALYPESDEEMQLTADALKIPYIMGYTGGELCPVADKNGVLRNRFHNFTYTSCLL
ncbi:MAG: FIST C-terminal domain-containing protein [Defluviitaleaceae bacterium]|nr:FIST C-terminal domain-containing protein [Defluviitaleaceae bacterium]